MLQSRAPLKPKPVKVQVPKKAVTVKPGEAFPADETYDAEFQRARPLVRQRSRGYCEAALDGICKVGAVHVHHRKRRSQGGSNQMVNLLDLCRPCHEWIHAHPRLSYDWGLLVRRNEDPADLPIL